MEEGIRICNMDYFICLSGLPFLNPTPNRISNSVSGRIDLAIQISKASYQVSGWIIGQISGGISNLAQLNYQISSSPDIRSSNSGSRISTKLDILPFTYCTARYNPNDEQGAAFFCTQTDFSAASPDNVLEIGK